MSPFRIGQEPERIFRAMRNPYQGFPWTGDFGMGITASCAAFNPAFKVYSLPLHDMSRPETNKIDMFDELVTEFQETFKVGDSVNAIRISPDGNKNMSITGKISDYRIDYQNKRIRVYVRDDKDMSVSEVYPETLFNNDGLYESLKRNFNDSIKTILG